MVDMRDGSINYNRVEDHGAIRGSFVSRGRLQSRPRFTDVFTGGENAGTGYYRRIYSIPKPATGDTLWVNEAAAVTLPCGNGPNADGAGVAGQIYEGGWGNGSGYANAVDAGLAYDRYNSRGVYSNGPDAYTTFMHVGNGDQFNGYFVYSGSGTQNPGGNFHLACGYPATLSYVVQDHYSNGQPTGTYDQLVSAQQQSGNQIINWVVLVNVGQSGVGGWTSACKGCIVKRMTSLAINPEPYPSNFQGGFTTQWSGATLGCGFSYQCYQSVHQFYNFSWTSNFTGGCSEYAPWSGTYNTSDCSNSPSQAAVRVWDYTADGEADAISVDTTRRSLPPGPRSPGGNI